MALVFGLAGSNDDFELLQREWNEQRRWTRFGAPIATFGWLGGLYGGDGFERDPVLVGLLAAALLGLSVFRIAVLSVPPPDVAGLRLALGWSWKLLLLSVICWSLCTAYLYAHSPFGTLMMAVTIGVSLQTAGYAYSFAGRHALGMIGIPVLYAPTLLHYWTHPELGASAYVTGASFVYLLMAAWQVRRDRTERLRMEQTIRRQATDFEELSKRDWLTGLDNRRSFIAEAEDQIHHRQPHLSLLLLDVDHFKRINDEFGHAAGDQCLVELANALRRACGNRTALCARIGGDEFAVLLARTPLDAALELAQAVRQRLVLSARAGDEAPPFTVSIGAGEFIADVHANADAFIASVDAALYRAKAYGRDQVRCSVAMGHMAAG